MNANVDPAVLQPAPSWEGAQGKSYVLEIPIDQLCPDPHQPRKTFDEDELDELAGSIEDLGPQQLPLVNPRCVLDGKEYFYIKAGERRWRAHKKLGKKTIICVVEPVVYNGTRSFERRLSQVAENSSRVKHTHSEIVALLCDAIDEEIKNRGGKAHGAIGVALRRVGRAFGKKSITWAENYRKLTHLHEDLLVLLDRDDDAKLNFQLALTLAAAPREKQQEILARAEEVRARGGVNAMKRYVVRTVRGEGVAVGRNDWRSRPSDDRERLTNLIRTILRNTVTFSEGMTTPGLNAFLSTVLSGMDVSEASELLHSIREAEETLKLIEAQLRSRAEYRVR